MITNAEIENRIKSGEPFTYGELARCFDQAAQGRNADAIIQRWRRNGWITMERKGKEIIWTLTDLGRKAHSGTAAPAIADMQASRNQGNQK